MEYKKNTFDLEVIREKALKNDWLSCDIQRDGTVFMENEDIKIIDTNSIMEYIEKIHEIPIEILKRHKNWLAYEIGLSPNKIKMIIEHIKVCFPEARIGNEIFIEYFRNYDNLKKFLQSVILDKG